MRARLHVDQPLRESGQCLDLPPGAARHVQVLRAQPGERLALFDGLSDLEWQAEVTAMGRSAGGRALVGGPNGGQRAAAGRHAGGGDAGQRPQWTSWWRKPPNWAPARCSP
jgi:hypothetical protein